MKTCKVAGTLRVPSAQPQMPLCVADPFSKPLTLGGLHTDHEFMVLGACYFACLMLVAGCGLEGPIPSGPKREAPAANKAPEPNAVAEPSSAEKKKPRMVREKAAVGMGEKGRGYGGGMITTPVKTLFLAKESIFMSEMRHAMDLYKAANDGHAPKTQDEFMQRIIKENNIQLPALPAGERYVYDPSTGELMVEKPKEP